MSSPVTIGGFNNIDFNAILNLMMEQERQPLKTLQGQQQALKAQSTAYSTLATKLSALSAASSALGGREGFDSRSVTTTDKTIVDATATMDAIPGTYEVVVRALARSQVTPSSSRHADTEVTTVATGGTLVIGGVPVLLTGAVTLKGLADAINRTSGIGVTASIVRLAAGSYQLVLTSRNTGVANAFTITNGLAGSTVAFTDTNADGVSGDSPQDNAMQAVDADLLVNNIAIVSTTNTVEDAIPGTTLTLVRQAPGTTVSLGVTKAPDATRSLIEKFVESYNDLMSFLQQQGTATGGIGRDPLSRSLRNDLRSTLTAEYASGGAWSSLATVGVAFSRTGKLEVDAGRLTAALAAGEVDVRQLFQGDGTNAGVVSAVADTIDRYAEAGALIADTQDRITAQVRSLDQRLAALELRLADRRATLQREFSVADTLMAQLNGQSGSLQNLGGQYRLF